jgi:regulatory protein
MVAGDGAAAAALRARALRWLAQREHSRSELRAKLLRVAGAAAGSFGRRGGAGDGDGDAGPPPDPAEIDALLDHLQRQGLLSDERFVQSRLRLRGGQHGLRRLEAELSRHAVALPAADRQRLLATELSRAIELWRHRFGGLAADPKQRAKQMRFLAGRGFSPEVIRKAADELRRGPADRADRVD